MERNSLIDKALRFLRQAPNQTEAHIVGWGPNRWTVLGKCIWYVQTKFTLLAVSRKLLRARPGHATQGEQSAELQARADIFPAT